MKFHLYRIMNRKNGMSYVGRTSNLERRTARHFRELRNGTHHNASLQKDWDHGEESDFDVIVESVVETLDEAVKAEQLLIDAGIGASLYNIGQSRFGDALTHNPDREEIIERISQATRDRYTAMTPEEKREKFTQIPNPMQGKHHSEAVRKALSERAKGNSYAKGAVRSPAQRAKLSLIASQRVGDKNSFFGKSHTEETRQRLSESRMGSVPSNIKAVSIDGVEFTSMAEASRALDIPVPTIHYRVNSGSPKWDGFKYKTDVNA